MTFFNIKKNIIKNRKVFLIHLLINICVPILLFILAVFTGSPKDALYFLYLLLLASFSTYVFLFILFFLTNFFIDFVSIFFIDFVSIFSFSLNIEGDLVFNIFFISIILFVLIIRFFILYFIFYLDISKMDKKYILPILDVVFGLLGIALIFLGISV